MKKYPFIFMACFLITSPLFAQTVQLNGAIETDLRTLMTEPHDYSYQNVELILKTEAAPTEQSKVFGELTFTGTSLGTVSNSTMLSQKKTLLPWDVELTEAYYEVYDFLIADLNLKIGRQRIAWGRGDKINPTDTINADDLSDIWDYGAHLGSDGFKLSYLIQDVTIDAIYIPLFTPALLPTGDYRHVLMPANTLPAGITLESVSDTIIMPQQSLQYGYTAAVKVSGMVAGYDISLSWVHGRDDLPIMTRTVLTPAGPTAVHAAAELTYPRMNVAGLDIAGAIGDIGIWGEIAVFMAEQIIETTDMTALGMGTTQKEALGTNPYAKYVLGADYNFSNGIYINLQYLHGFIHERGCTNLNNYIFMNVDWSLLEDTLTITPVGIALEMADFNNLEEHYAFLAMPQVACKPVDNLTLTLGGRWIWGSSSTNFGKLADKDEIYIKGLYQF